ncbi:MAG: exodeoxyribonuclease VII large subunit [Bacteroidetes bacterium]|nr:exodeoxyribonuclease VII large subunit [Bacteroidota bacterium]
MRAFLFLTGSDTGYLFVHGTISIFTPMMHEDHILTVSELTRDIKYMLEMNFSRVWVQGEISNFKLHTSGHMYFTLKDERAQLSAVFWRSRNTLMPLKPVDGMKVLALGSITVYPPHGNYQLDVEKLQPLGIGELQMLFEQLKRKLAAEGLFDARHKKPIPRYPQRIGVITSETGAALRDILTILARRNPSIEVVLYPVRVQGVGAAEEIAQAIRECNEYGNLDVLIIGRGGGSLEDLWPFNEEIVARAIYESHIPTISAVGHEVDVSIADFVADLRAPTPSAAAELVARDRNEIVAELATRTATMRRVILAYIDQLKNSVVMSVKSYEFHKPRTMVREYNQKIDDIIERLHVLVPSMIESKTITLGTIEKQLRALNPYNVLRRGYTIVRKHGKTVSSSALLHANDEAEIQFHDGIVNARVERTRK